MRKLKPITWQYMTLYNNKKQKQKKLIHKIAAKHNDKDTESNVNFFFKPCWEFIHSSSIKMEHPLLFFLFSFLFFFKFFLQSTP